MSVVILKILKCGQNGAMCVRQLLFQEKEINLLRKKEQRKGKEKDDMINVVLNAKLRITKSKKCVNANNRDIFYCSIISYKEEDVTHTHTHITTTTTTTTVA